MLCSEDFKQKMEKQRPEISIDAYIDDCFDSYCSNDSFSFNSAEIEWDSYIQKNDRVIKTKIIYFNIIIEIKLTNFY